MDESEKMQKHAARSVTNNCYYGVHVTEMTVKLSWPSVADRRKHIKLALFYKARAVQPVAPVDVAPIAAAKPACIEPAAGNRLAVSTTPRRRPASGR